MQSSAVKGFDYKEKDIGDYGMRTVFDGDIEAGAAAIADALNSI